MKKMSEDKRHLISIGVFFLVLVATLLLFALNIIGWTLIVPMVLVLCGAWMLVISVMRGSSPLKYERDSFSMLSLGLLLLAVGGAWYLFESNWIYSIALILLVLGVLAIATALKRK
jgi:hypothetical protein